MSGRENTCWNCKFFAISWDPNYRYECKQMGFKSSQLPSQQVKMIDNRECLAFQAKKEEKNTRPNRGQ